MATLIILKRRIKTTRNVSKTTKAMQLISASKLKRAQDAAMLSKPYVQKLDELSKRLSRKIDKENINEYMIKPDNTNSKLIIVVSPDKGLSGGLVTNLIKEVLVIENKNKNYYITVGKKAENYVSGFGKEIIASFPFGSTIPAFDMVYPIFKSLVLHFEDVLFAHRLVFFLRKIQGILVLEPVVFPLEPDHYIAGVVPRIKVSDVSSVVFSIRKIIHQEPDNNGEDDKQ